MPIVFEQVTADVAPEAGATPPAPPPPPAGADATALAQTLEQVRREAALRAERQQRCLAD